MDATAVAHPNIALIKYWGKRDVALNLPATGSLSITLDTLRTRTSVRFLDDSRQDELWLNGARVADLPPRVVRVLDLLRTIAGTDAAAVVHSDNDFPTGAGLASSASGFAALVTAADAALDLGLPQSRLSELARVGSGSAARSIFGGFAELSRGTSADGTDSYATPLLDKDAWPLQVVVAVVSLAPKQIGSGAGMERSRLTSPFYDAWVAGAEHDLHEAREAVLHRDFAALAGLSEHSCAKMHSVMLSTRPALLYWTGATVQCLHLIRDLREDGGLGVFFTVDAGPQVKAVCLPGDAAQVARALSEVPGVVEVRLSGLGDGARVVPTAEASR